MIRSVANGDIVTLAEAEVLVGEIERLHTELDKVEARVCDAKEAWLTILPPV